MAGSAQDTTNTPLMSTTRSNHPILNNSLLHVPSSNLIISCGAIPIDPQTRKIAIIRDPRKANFIFLPKGRKNIGEDFLSAALRETFEETGITVRALPLKIPTRATPAQVKEEEEEEEEEEEDKKQEGTENPGITKGVENFEPSSVSIFPWYDGLDVVKLIFWFAAAADSTAKRAEETQESWEEGWEIEWVDAGDVAGLMSFDGDRKVVEKVLQDMRDSGYDI